MPLTRPGGASPGPAAALLCSWSRVLTTSEGHAMGMVHMAPRDMHQRSVGWWVDTTSTCSLTSTPPASSAAPPAERQRRRGTPGRQTGD